MKVALATGGRQVFSAVRSEKTVLIERVIAAAAAGGAGNVIKGRCYPRRSDCR